MPATTDTHLPATVRAHLEAGRRIDAVKALRAETGDDLRTAVARIDAFVRTDPVLAARMAEQQALVRGRARWVFAIAALLVFVAGWAVFGR